MCHISEWSMVYAVRKMFRTVSFRISLPSGIRSGTDGPDAVSPKFGYFCASFNQV